MTKSVGMKIWVSTRDYIMIVLGICLYAFAFCAFILPEKVVIGGLTGLGSLVYFTTGIPVAFTQYIMNLTLLAFAYKIVGKQFVMRTIFGATVISLAIGVFQPLFPEPIIAQQTFMNVIIGGLLIGVGIGIAFTHNGSTGGTDIVAAMVSKRSNVTVGRTMLYTDMCIISSSYLIFHEIDKVVYGLVVLFLAAWVADQVINTNRQACQFTIFSKKWQEIATAINNEAHRGCTVLSAMGWYSKQEVKVLLVMCRKIESVTIFRIIKSIDRDAFVTQANVNGVYGQGFDEFKVKMKPTDGEHPHPAASASDTPQAQASHSGHPQSLA
ncbi:MAG: YitT family protein [Bacteroidales bacterium]|nr:YitT family protein [Bacteroidales bacterium]MCD8395498.1 YitT family protein [Bacteroidales bacterium]